MKEGLGVIIIIVAAILLVLGISFFSLWHYGYFAPKVKAIEREVWENTPSRIHGATQEIAKRYSEYNKAEENDKKAICATLRNMYSNLNPEVIDDRELREFFKTCKYGG